MKEWNDIYDADRRKTGKRHLRGTRWLPGQYGLVVCIWVYDGRGNILLTRRAPEKSFAGTWENSGGAARAGEDSRTAIVRELYEETGIRILPQEAELLGSDRDGCTHYDFYCVRRDVSISQIVLQPGETDGVMWADFERIHRMIDAGEICSIIGHQFYRQEQDLRIRNLPKNNP